MPNFYPKIPLSYVLTFTANDVARALGVDNTAHHGRWSTRFCADKTNSCTLDLAEAVGLVRDVDSLLRRYHGGRASAVDRSITHAVEGLFWLFHDAIERCVELDVACRCSWTRRMNDAEALAAYLVLVAQAYWSTGEERAWMFKQIETLACLVTIVAERDGSIARRVGDDPSVEARADRLAIALFDAANDLICDNWMREDWMSAVIGK